MWQNDHQGRYNIVLLGNSPMATEVALGNNLQCCNFSYNYSSPSNSIDDSYNIILRANGTSQNILTFPISELNKCV